MTIIKGEISKITSYKDPVSFTVRDENDDGSTSLKNIIYNGFLPAREGDTVYAKCSHEQGHYYAIFKPLVLIPSDQKNIKNCILKALRTRKINFTKIDNFYNELVKLCDLNDSTPYVKDKKDSRNIYIKEKKEDIIEDKIIELNTDDEEDDFDCEEDIDGEKIIKIGEEIVKFLDKMCFNQDIKFHSISNNETAIFLDWWKNNHLFRRLYLFGLNKKEIRESGLSPQILYEQLKRNPFKVSSIPLPKAGEIYRLFGKTPTEDDIYCGGILRGMDKLMNFGSLACYKWIIQKEFPRFEQFQEVLVNEFDVLIKDNFLYTNYSYEIESRVAEGIAKRMLEEKKMKEKIAKLGIDINLDSPYHVFAEPNFVLTKEQEWALFGCLNNHISIITGGAGCGKTTLIKQIVKNLQKNGESFMLTSLTGKAVLRMREVIGLKDDNALTMHRLIHNRLRIKKFYHLIIDEASMIPTELMYQFFDSFPHYFKITFVGDPNQLIPIGKGRLFLDLISFSPPNTITDEEYQGLDTYKINHYKLTVNKRFADNNILLNSNGLISEDRDRTIPYNFTSGKGFYLVKGDLSVCNKIINTLYKKNVNGDRITLLTPANKDINELVGYFRETYLQGSKKHNINERTFYIGDRVMQNRNVYLDNTYDIMNGEEGKITVISSENISVDYGNNKVIKYNYIQSELDKEVEDIEEEKLSIKDIVVSFAKTIHRSQGSEYDFVVLYIPEGMNNFVNINMLYTGITRAKKSIWIVSEIKTLLDCTTKYLKEVPSLLKEKIEQLF